MANQPPPFEKHQQYPTLPPYPNLPPYPMHEQQPMYPIPQQQQPVHHHQTNIVQAPVVVATSMGPRPQIVTCANCGQSGTSTMRYESHTTTHMIALIMCIFCCWPCAFLPYCMNSCRHGNHYCSSCKQFIGTYKS